MSACMVLKLSIKYGMTNLHTNYTTTPVISFPQLCTIRVSYPKFHVHIKCVAKTGSDVISEIWSTVIYCIVYVQISM